MPGSVEPSKLESFIGKLVGDMSAAIAGSLVAMGDKLGLYKALAKGGNMTSADLATATGLTERYVREWLAAQAAGGYVEYDKARKAFYMTAEQAATLADDTQPTFMAGAFDVIATTYIDAEKIEAAFKSGKGVGWHEHHNCLFRGTERFFRPGYQANLVGSWLPALSGVVAKLEKGAKVADVGCGHGASTIIMAQAFPNSHFVGFDYHEASITRAKAAAKTADVSRNTEFHSAAAQDFKGDGFDLIACFDCLHDMGDPVGAAKHIKNALKPDGSFMLVEPFAHDTLEENLNVVGRLFYSASTMICTPASLSQEGAAGLGAQAGEKRLGEVLKEGGFKTVRRATATPFNLILEAKP